MYLMEKLSFIFVCICVLHRNNTLGLTAVSNPGKPEIVSAPLTTIGKYDNHSVLCQGDRPLKWTTPVVEEDKESWTTFVVLADIPLKTSYQYGSRLHIINMTYPFVGFYKCHYADTDKEDMDGTASIYIFLNDLEHLAVQKQEEPIIVTQYKETLIPCKPTSPDIQVRLVNSSLLDTVALLQKIVPDETLYSYDPKYGFFTRDTRSPATQSFYCGFLKDLKLEYFPIQVIVEESISHLPTPQLIELSNGHIDINQTLVLECTVSTKNDVHFHWGAPSPFNQSRVNIRKIRQGDTLVGHFIIQKTVKSDTGTYFCNITDNQNHSAYTNLKVKIFDTNEYFLILELENGTVNATVASAGEPQVQWNFTVKGHPKPTVKWFNNRNQTIPIKNGSKYEAWYDEPASRAFLRIKDPAINDTGYFTILAMNNKLQQMILFLNVTDKPNIELDVNAFHLINSHSTAKCYAYANPKPEFQWYLKLCQSSACDYMPINGTVSQSEEFIFVSTVTINITEKGQLKCFAKNYKGKSSVTKTFFISDIKNGFDVFTLDADVDINEEGKIVTIAEGDKATVMCGASNETYSDITWLFNGNPLTNNDEYRLTKSNTKYSSKLELELQHPSISDSGVYCCRVTKNTGEYLFQNMTFNVTSPEPPQIINTTLQDEREIDLPISLILFCKISGVPKPILKWYKNGITFQTLETERIHISQDKEIITFSHTTVQDEGTYKCEAKNRMGSITKQQIVKFKNLPQASYGWFLIIFVLLSLIFIGTIIFFIIKIRRDKQQQNELEMLGLTSFQKGAVENINPDLGLDEQADLLPYDQKWEFPRERLTLGKQLGSGAFGVVMQAVAKGIVEGEYETTVAVKMIKKNVDHTYMKALASELKIMVHLGKHLNVVNLLGACTKNVANRELLVIVEFCRFGNLHNYLLKHRDNYKDQVDLKSENRAYSSIDDGSNIQLNSLGYVDMQLSKDNNQPIVPPRNDIVNYRNNSNFDIRPTADTATVPQDAMKNSNETNSKHLNLEEKYAMKFLQKLQKTNYINPELYKSKEFE